MDCSLPGSSVHGIFQAKVREWGAIAFYAGDSTPPEKYKASLVVLIYRILQATSQKLRA